MYIVPRESIGQSFAYLNHSSAVDLSMEGRGAIGVEGVGCGGELGCSPEKIIFLTQNLYDWIQSRPTGLQFSRLCLF